MPQGYGMFFIAGRNVRAHRAAWVLKRGDIPYGKYVCHTCTSKNCVNPEHLYVGTAEQNSADIWRLGGHARPMNVLDSVLFSIRITRRARRRLTEAARVRGVSRGALVEAMIMEYLEETPDE